MFKDFFQNIVQNFLQIFAPKNLIWHALAIVITVVLVLGGVDWWYFEHTRFDWAQPLIFVAGIGGFFVPVIIPILAYYLGEFKKNRALMLTGAASAQSVVLGYFVSVFYKIFTGRTQPEYLTHFSTVDISHEFHFGILQNGIFWGWPSSHAAVAFAFATAFTLMSRNTFVRISAIAYPLLVAIGASIGFHWLSDTVAGAILGTLVGFVVVQNFKLRS